ncbi:leucine-rich repeat protein [Anaerobutyricum hallii]|uniref:leucine-rich repeat protein n=1 Tax=Anaerobutyricum hallii TaxID=39488 RepID=UPI0035204774
MKKVLTAFFFCLLFSVSVQAKDVLPTNKTTASEGCTLVGVEEKYITDAQNALKRINEIRYEACKEGVWKMDSYGNPTKEKLTVSDYNPIKWSSALEYIARIRAAEATVVLAHERPNDENFFTSTLTSNGQKSYSENLAWNGGKSMLSGIEQWYKEKSDWVNKTGKTTGHYTSMINPDYNYVAVATFYNPDAAYKNATSAEFSHKKGLDETMNEMAGECIQILEVKDSYLSLKLPVNNTSIKAGENTQAQANAVITNPSAIMHGETCEASLIGDITWTSSNKQVATVDKDGKITGIDYGTATITAKSGTLSQTITVNVTTHAWDTGKVTTPPKCEEKGVKTYTCTKCEATKTEEIAATGHQHTEIRDAKEAECETAGYTGDTYCTDCDKKLKDGKEIEATGHQNTEVRNAKEATCKETGYTGDTYCLKCEKKISTGTEIAKKPHTWNAGKVTTAPQCEKEGVKTYICTKCGATKTEAVEATGHQHTEIRNAKEAECETTGYTGDTYCTDCNKKLKEGVVIELTGHQNIEVRDAVEATCKKAGYTGDIYCLKCGKQISTGIEIPSKAHSWGTGKITKPASYTKTGIKTYTCKICGTKRTEAINKIPMPRVGTVYTIAGNQYRITKIGAEVSLIKTNAKAKSINIPATIKANGITYKVTTIAAKAFKQNKKLQSVTVGANVKSISNNAFFKCLSLKTVNLKTVLLTSKTASKKAFKGANKKLVIKVPKKVKKSYKKIFKGLKVK